MLNGGQDECQKGGQDKLHMGIDNTMNEKINRWPL
jgi:hypothetical protein